MTKANSKHFDDDIKKSTTRIEKPSFRMVRLNFNIKMFVICI